MAYDRYDTRRDRERGGYRDNDRGRGEDRGFFERAGDEIASWFGDEESERRRREDERMMNRGERGNDRDRYAIGGWGERDRDYDRGRYAYGGREFDRDRNRSFGRNESDRSSRTSSESDYQSGYAGYERESSPRGYGARGIDRGHNPSYVGGSGYTGGYAGYGYGSGSDRGYGSGGFGGDFTGSDYERRDSDRSESPWGRDDYRRTSFAGSSRDNDRHYHSWRQRQLDDLDRDYDEYQRERQQRFEEDFGTWREQRQQKRSFLPQIREHMDVVGNDGDTVGKVDRVLRDRIVLTKSDSEDDRHHSISCSMIDTVEGDQVRLDVSAEEAKNRWRDEDRSGPAGREEDEDVNLERSFSGTYS